MVCVFFFHFSIWRGSKNSKSQRASAAARALTATPTALPHATCGVICTLTLTQSHTHALRPNICSWHIDTVSMQRQMCCISCPSLRAPLPRSAPSLAACWNFVDLFFFRLATLLPNVKRLIRELTANFFDLCVPECQPSCCCCCC